MAITLRPILPTWSVASIVNSVLGFRRKTASCVSMTEVAAAICIILLTMAMDMIRKTNPKAQTVTLANSMKFNVRMGIRIKNAAAYIKSLSLALLQSLSIITRAMPVITMKALNRSVDNMFLCSEIKYIVMIFKILAAKRELAR